MKKEFKLLYAEDEQATRKDHIKYIESRYDFDIYEANDGIEALSLYKEHEPDIVLTDITMPNMCGLELVKEIRKISNHTKIIILTAHSEQDKLIQALELNVVSYILKPINRRKLNESLEIALDTIYKSGYPEKDYIYLGVNVKFNMTSYEYFVDDDVVKLTKSEGKLLELLCVHKNMDVSSFDIFVYIWDDFEKEFSADSVRTIVKKLRKKLPEGILKNNYGGFYKLEI